MYIDTAKTFISLSSGALGLTMVLREKIVGAKPGTGVTRLLLSAWAFYLVAICAGAFYTYEAVNFLDAQSCSPGEAGPFQVLVDSPGYLYSLMLSTFIVASVLLVLSSWTQLSTMSKPKGESAPEEYRD